MVSMVHVDGNYLLVYGGLYFHHTFLALWANLSLYLELSI